MAFPLFEGTSHAKLYRQFRVKPPKELIQRIIDFLREKYSGKLTQAVDVGCGSGQCTFGVAEYFDQVLGTDISSAQIEEANGELKELEIKNVSFCLAPAEKLPLNTGSVQLITACTAAHWMDLPKVYEEGKRVLCPGGVMAFFCYELPRFFIENDTTKNQALDEIMDEAMKVLLEHAASPFKLVIDKYKDIEIPYSDFTRESDFQTDIKISLSGILGTIRTFSPFQTLCEKNGQAAGLEFINTVQNKLAKLAGIGEEDFDTPLFVNVHNYFLIMARV